MLDDIKRRLAAATPGPWKDHGGPSWGTVSTELFAVAPDRWDPNETHAVMAEKEADAEFIANAPTDMARLIAALEAVRSIRESNAFDDYERDYTAGYNDALEEVNAAINSHLGES